MMRFACPSCGQKFETEAQVSEVACPTCGCRMALPPVASRPPTPKAARASYRPQPTPPRKNGGGKLLLFLLALAVGGSVFGSYYFHESPQAFWKRALDYVRGASRPSAPASPTPRPEISPSRPPEHSSSKPELASPIPTPEARATAEPSPEPVPRVERETPVAPFAAAQPSPAPAETFRPEVEDLASDTGPPKAGAFVHPGLLHNDEDFARMRAKKNRQPWKSGWEKLVANRHSSLDYKPNPAEIVVRGRDRLHTDPENYRQLFNDAAAAYQCALRWRVSGDRRYAEKSVEILNAWGSTLKQVKGSTDACLAMGIYGYELANAAEIMRTYKGWKPEDFSRFQTMMLEVFAKGNEDFLVRHNGTRDDHYWANWDLCNMASLMAIGVLCDQRPLYDKAVSYFKNGKGMGAIKHAVNHIHPGGLGQWQESGRDQGHTLMGIAIMAAICEMAWKQGDDLYGYDDNRFLKGCEYVAKYNLGEDVPFEPYSNDKVTQTVVSPVGRGSARPAWELPYNHYVVRKGLPAPYTARIAAQGRPEGGGGDYGPNSGGFDQLGFGTLTATLDKQDKGARPFGSAPWPQTAAPRK